jgi:hypothetical protein
MYTVGGWGFDAAASAAASAVVPGAGAVFGGVVRSGEKAVGKAIGKKVMREAEESVIEHADEAAARRLLREVEERSTGAVRHSEQAAAERAQNMASGIPASQLGPSGKPKIHVKEHATRKRAQDAAQAESRRGVAPEEHSNPTVGDPHYHPSGTRHREHHTYPRGNYPKNEAY